MSLALLPHVSVPVGAPAAQAHQAAIPGGVRPGAFNARAGSIETGNRGVPAPSCGGAPAPSLSCAVLPREAAGGGVKSMDGLLLGPSARPSTSPPADIAALRFTVWPASRAALRELVRALCENFYARVAAGLVSPRTPALDHPGRVKTRWQHSPAHMARMSALSKAKREGAPPTLPARGVAAK